jgi:YbbR domain-containing protein
VRSILRAVTNNWRLKLLAFALATLLWVVVGADQITSQWLNIPLQVELQDERWELVEDAVPREVAVRFVGPARELIDVAMDRPRVVLRITRVDALTQSFPLSPGMVQMQRLPTISAQDVRPGQIRLQFERLSSREVPVRVEVGREPRAPFVLVDSPSPVPGMILVRGAASAVERVSEVRTQPIDLAREDSSFERQVRLQRPADVEVQLGVESVAVTGRVDRLVERVVANVPVVAPAGTRAVTATVEVRLRGPHATLSALQLHTLRAVATPDSLPTTWPEGGLPVAVSVEGLPAGVTANVQPDIVRLVAASPAPSPATPQPATPPASETPPGGR